MALATFLGHPVVLLIEAVPTIIRDPTLAAESRAAASNKKRMKFWTVGGWLRNNTDGLVRAPEQSILRLSFSKNQFHWNDRE